jgi:D-beta-D-heptose 7-phosphate kinase/D-beta-D-heptose 1-phosphate adenosyltransferase
VNALANISSVGRAYAAGLVRQFADLKIAVLGDPMLDYYHFGHVDRLSPEAPVPVFIEDKIDLRDGGAGNVAANLAGLGCQVLSIFPPAPYSMKHRYLVGSQQLFRIDNDRDHSKHTQEIDWYWLGALDAQAFVISDYGKGWCTDARCQSFIKIAREHEIPVIVDPKGTDWLKYVGATVICPNEKEWEAVDCWHPKGTVVVAKHGPKGLAVVRHDGEAQTAHLLPACARHVFDVTGAGDTVTAVLAAALAIRCEVDIAAELANIAAGIVVGEVGTTAITSAVLIRELEQ